MEQNTASLLKKLSLCSEACDEFISSEFSESDTFKYARCIEFCKDCETICETTVSFIERRSWFTKKVLKFCSEVCHKCADELLKTMPSEYKKYAEACRLCAQECAGAS